jgi:CHAT domain-containing protein
MPSVLATVSELLLGSIAPRLADRHIEDLLIVPHRGLHLLPFSAFPIRGESQTSVLIDRYNLWQLPSVSVAALAGARPRSDRGPARLGAVADPTGDLPGAREEVERVVAVFGPERCLVVAGEEARVERLPEVLARNHFHFAGHGLHRLDDLLASELLFAGRQSLTLGDLFDEMVSFQEVEQACLSACETGQMNPADVADECFGLSAGVLFAGAANVLSSLWEVEDRTTAQLIARFYQELPASGNNSAAALRKAQRWLRESGGRGESEASPPDEAARTLQGAGPASPSHRRAGRDFAHPYFWAAFTLARTLPSASLEGLGGST